MTVQLKEHRFHPSRQHKI